MATPKCIGDDATGRETPSELDEVVTQPRAFRKDPEPVPHFSY